MLQPRWRAERALVSGGIQEAYAKGVSTRKVEDLVRAFRARLGHPQAAASAARAFLPIRWPLDLRAFVLEHL